MWFGMGELSFKFKAPGAITVEADTEMCPSHAVSVYPGIRGSTTLDENSRVHTSPSPEMTNVSMSLCLEFLHMELQHRAAALASG